jgi:hypothetical protein
LPQEQLVLFTRRLRSSGDPIVSHIAQFDLDSAIAELKKFYTGPLTIGADLPCTPVQ